MILSVLAPLLAAVPPWIWHTLLGAFIGSVTNGVALAALFRPKKGLRIGKFNIAGIVPLRRRALAAAVGKQVGEQLLNEDVVENILLGDDAKNFVEHVLIEGTIQTLQQDSRTMDDILREWLGEGEFASLEAQLHEIVADGMATLMQSDAFADDVASAVERSGVEWLRSNIAHLTDSEHYFALRYGLREVAQRAVESGLLRERLMSFARDYVDGIQSITTPLQQIVPARVQRSLRRFILAEGPRLADHFVAYIESPSVKQRLEDGVNDIINSFSWITRMVAQHYDRKHDIAQQVIYYVANFLEDAQSQKELTAKLTELVDRTLAHSPAEIVARLGRDNVDGMVEAIVNNVATMGNVDLVMDNVDRYLRRQAERGLGVRRELELEPDVQRGAASQGVEQREWDPSDRGGAEAAAGLDVGGDAPWRAPLRAGLRLLLSGEGFRNILLGMAPSIVKTGLGLRPGTFALSLESTRLTALAMPLYEKLIRTHARTAFQHIPIAPYVEEQINSLDLDEIEHMIKSVMRTELGVIVAAGGILGAIIGFVGTFL